MMAQARSVMRGTARFIGLPPPKPKGIWTRLLAPSRSGRSICRSNWDIYEEMRRVGVTTTAHFNETVYAAMRRYAQRNFDSGRRVQALLDAPEPRAEAGETIRLHRMAHWDDGVWDCCYVKSCSFDEHAYFQRTAAPGQQEKP